jgi:hypothetical protein
MPVYKPLADFLSYTPTKRCSQYILEDCTVAFDSRRPGSSAFLQKLVEEASRVTDSKLSFAEPPGGEPALAFALACYTFDLSPFGAAPWQNFFELVASALHCRDYTLLKQMAGYLYFLFSGLHKLPAMPQKEYARGVPALHLEAVQRDYTSGRLIHWAGLVSLSELPAVARRNAGGGGIIFWVTARSARGIRQYSEVEEEAEVVLLPNFEGMVTQPAMVGSDGLWHVRVLEAASGSSRFKY